MEVMVLFVGIVSAPGVGAQLDFNVFEWSSLPVTC